MPRIHSESPFVSPIEGTATGAPNGRISISRTSFHYGLQRTRQHSGPREGIAANAVQYRLIQTTLRNLFVWLRLRHS